MKKCMVHEELAFENLGHEDNYMVREELVYEDLGHENVYGS